MSEWKNFPRHELQCPCCGRQEMDADYMDRLQRARTLVGFAVPLTSAFRCSDYDRLKGGSSCPGNGPHARGRATDANLWGVKLLIWFLACMVVGLIRLPNWRGREGWGGIGLLQKGPSKGRFIHIDNLRPEEYSPRPRLWTY